MRTATVASPPAEAAENDFMSSVCEWLGSGSGVRFDLLAEQRQALPCDPIVPLQQHDPLAPQHPSPFEEEAMSAPQQEWRGRDPAMQCGHLEADVESARTDVI